MPETLRTLNLEACGRDVPRLQTTLYILKLVVMPIESIFVGADYHWQAPLQQPAVPFRPVLRRTPRTIVRRSVGANQRFPPCSVRSLSSTVVRISLVTQCFIGAARLRHHCRHMPIGQRSCTCPRPQIEDRLQSAEPCCAASAQLNVRPA